jgi:hypothetical protein
MNKKAKRRASVVFVLVFVLYVSVAMKVEERFSFGRVRVDQAATPHGMSLMASRPAPVEKEAPPAPGGGNAPDEKAPGEEDTTDSPKLQQRGHTDPLSPLLALPLVCFAIKEKKLDREELIPCGKNAKGQQAWKKPEDILRDRDNEGLKNIARMTGKRTTAEFLQKLDIPAGRDLLPEEVMLGEGFSVDRAKLLAAYNQFVTAEYEKLLPYGSQGRVIVRNRDGFALVHEKQASRGSGEVEPQAWSMPDVTTLSMKSAIEKLNAHTAKIRIYGSGYVVEQHPRPLEKVQGETECVLYGKTYVR